MSRTRKFPTTESAKDRRDLGAVYTPLWMARTIVDRTMSFAAVTGEDSKLRILDPACGDGIFLQAAYESLLSTHDKTSRKSSDFAKRLTIAKEGIFGVDVDEVAVHAARRRIAQLIVSSHRREESPSDSMARDEVRNREEDSELERVSRLLAKNIVHGNALFDRDDVAVHGDANAIGWGEQFWSHFGARGFDVVVGNPPYVNIRRISKTYGEVAREYLKSRYATASGNFDLYVLFMELANRLLKPGGMAGLIVPNKLGTMKYARACRHMLLTETTVKQISDVSEVDVFQGTGVYPYVVLWENSVPALEHQVEVVMAKTQRELTNAEPRLVRQCDFNADQGLAIHGEMDIESRVNTKPLGQLCKLYSGTTGFAAQKIAGALVEVKDTTDEVFPFVVSGNIDRYQIQLGNVRYMKRRFESPGLPHECEEYSENKRKLYAGPKIVVAGLTKKIEAAWDDRGLALGVQVYAANEFAVDHWYLLALLNSRLMTDLFRMRFNAKHLAGGYLAINKGQLELLPIVMGSSDREAKLISLIGELGQRQHKQPTTELDQQIDELVDDLYQVKTSKAA